MKHALLIVTTFLLFTFANAQSGLQFSQVYFTPVSLAAESTTALGTVPAGKVWKLEQVVSSSTSDVMGAYYFVFNGTSGKYTIPYFYTSDNNTISIEACYLCFWEIQKQWHGVF